MLDKGPTALKGPNKPDLDNYLVLKAEQITLDHNCSKLLETCSKLLETARNCSKLLETARNCWKQPRPRERGLVKINLFGCRNNLRGAPAAVRRSHSSMLWRGCRNDPRYERYL